MGDVIKLRQMIISELENETNEDLLNEIQFRILSNRAEAEEKFDWEDSLEFKKALDEAEQNITEGNVYTHHDVMAFVKKNYLNGGGLVK